jgi:gliding motility-associated-like protein
LLIISSVLPGIGQTSLPYACAGSTEAYGVQGMCNSVFTWEITGGSVVSGDGSDTVNIRWNYDRAVHSITVTERSEFGCEGTPLTATVRLKAPVVDLADENVCQNDQTTFTAFASYDTNITYLWSDGSTGNTLTSGTQGYVWVRVTGADQCVASDTAFLTVNPLPVVRLGRDTVLCGTESMEIDAGFYSTYAWSTGDIVNPITVNGRHSEPEPIWVTVTDGNGCTATSDTMVLKVCDAYVLFRNMPNTITPETDGKGDGKNDRWVIPNIDLFPDAVLEIYDRWGRLVYRTNDVYNNPWDGKSSSGKEMPMDAYYFVLDIRVKHVKPFTGYINVVR